MLKAPSAVLFILLAGAASAGAAEKSISLFNGKDLSGWTYHLRDAEAKMEDVWSVEDGVLACKGRPIGYIRTKEAFENYKLTFQWRWPQGGGNSGLLVHVQEKDNVWPKSLEVQLGSGNAGDFWVIGGVTIDLPEIQQRKKGRRHLNLTDGSEKPLGEWNTMEVVCDGEKVIVKVNDELVNQCHDCSVQKGTIAFQSEGTEIHFRNIELTPLN